MDKNQKRFIEIWERERKKGQVRYIVLNTAIFFVLLYLVTSIFNFGDLRNGDYNSLLDIRRVGMYLIASLLVVVFRWRRNERMYQNFTKDSEN